MKHSNFLLLLKSKHFYDAIKKHREHIKEYPELYAANTEEHKKQVEEQITALEYSYTLNAKPFFINAQKKKTEDFVQFSLFTTNGISENINVMVDNDAFDETTLKSILEVLTDRVALSALESITAKINEE